MSSELRGESGNGGGIGSAKTAKSRSRRFLRGAIAKLWPNQRLRWTREGGLYILIWFGLLGLSWYHQINLILLVAGLAAGPAVASIFASADMLKKLHVGRRSPRYVFSGEPLTIDYTIKNHRRLTAALALFLEDELVPVDRSLGATGLSPKVFWPRIAVRERAQSRWLGIAPKRGKYSFPAIELVTRFPFGLLERRLTQYSDQSMTVYPRIGQLTRRWHQIQREATETNQGSRHDRTAQQQEYHGLRDYRPGDSPRWIHWRTSARVGELMVKEFEQQNEQDLAILLDPWLPKAKVTSDCVI